MDDLESREQGGGIQRTSCACDLVLMFVYSRGDKHAREKPHHPPVTLFPVTKRPPPAPNRTPNPASTSLLACKISWFSDVSVTLVVAQALRVQYFQGGGRAWGMSLAGINGDMLASIWYLSVGRGRRGASSGRGQEGGWVGESVPMCLTAPPPQCLTEDAMGMTKRRSTRDGWVA